MDHLNAEQYLLGCILKQGDIIKELSLVPTDFGEGIHQQIFALMKEIDAQGEYVDPAAISIYGGKVIAPVGGANYLSQLMSSVPSVNNFQTYADYVKKASVIRKVKDKARQILDIESIRDFENVQLLIAEAEEALTAEDQKEFNLVESLGKLHEDLTTKKSREVNGIATGLRDLDQLLDGWKKQDLNIIAARPSMGKTAFALSLANHAAETGGYVTIFSLEMGNELLLKRMICMIGRIDSFKLKDPERYFSSEDWDRYMKAMGILNKYKDNLYISDHPAPTVQDIWKRVRQNIRKYPNQDHLVIIDYLTLIKGSGRERHIEVGEISRSLKRMARELNVSVILLSQLSRAVEQRQSKRPMLSDIRDSGEVEQDADTISFLYRDDYYNSDSAAQNIIEVIVAKNRNGPIGTIELAFLKEFNRFANLSRVSG